MHIIAFQVIVMVEGHRHQRAISQYLRSQYSATGYPYFILDRERSGYLSKLVSHSTSGGRFSNLRRS